MKFITIYNCIKILEKQLLKYLKKTESIFKWYYPTRWDLIKKKKILNFKNFLFLYTKISTTVRGDALSS